MKRSFAIALVLVAACAKATDAPKPAEPVAVGSVDAPPIDVSPRDEPELAPVKPDAGGAALPPTGDYDVIATLVSDDCAARDPLPARATLLVLGRAWKDGRIGANVPFPRSSGATDRSDVGIEPRKATTSTLHPDRSCPSYSVVRTVEVTSATHDVIRIAVKDEKSDPSGCGKPGKACTTRLDYTYGLVKEHCAAGCNPKIGPVMTDAGPRAGGLGVVDCVCAR